MILRRKSQQIAVFLGQARLSDTPESPYLTKLIRRLALGCALLIENFAISDGHLTAPQGPGLGLGLTGDEDVLKSFIKARMDDHTR